ncbi:MAG TPA: cobalamin-binding protein [Sulfuricaulis sp.]|nr:cobalamin-binding protein [Sulfuricaulis sp.]
MLAGMLAFALSARGAEITGTDDRGRTVRLPAPAQRIVALAPSITELAYAAGAGDRLVGVARYSDYPAAAKGIPQVGDASRIDLERVLSLKPDLVIGWKSGNQVADVERLETLGFKVYIVEPATLAAIPQLLRAVGSLAGTGAIAEGAAEEFERRVTALRERYGARPKVRVFYEIWHAPLMTVNGRHMINDVISLCGGTNVFAGLATLTPVVSLEGVIALQPEVVLGGSSATAPDAFAAQWRRYEGFAKLRNVKAMFVDPDHIQRQTPRILAGAQTVCEHLEKIRGSRRNN